MSAVYAGSLFKYRPAPMKLYRPMVSVVAALSNRKDSLDLDLTPTISMCAIDPTPPESDSHF